MSVFDKNFLQSAKRYRLSLLMIPNEIFFFFEGRSEHFYRLEDFGARDKGSRERGQRNPFEKLLCDKFSAADAHHPTDDKSRVSQIR